MVSVNDIELVALLVGGLDPARARALQERVTADAALRARLAALERRLAAEADAPADETPGAGPLWRVPSWPALLAAPAPVLGADRPRFTARIPEPPDPHQRLLVVLRRHQDGWLCVHPTDPDEVLRIADLPRDGDARTFELTADPDDPGPEWAVVLAPPELGPDWEAPIEARWRALASAVAAGEVPLLRVKPGVTGPRR